MIRNYFNYNENCETNKKVEETYSKTRDNDNYDQAASF